MTRIPILAVALALSACGYNERNSYVPINGNLIAIDGDTFKVSGQHERYRLARIDAPEMPGHCAPRRQCAPGDPFAAQRALQWLLDRGDTSCTTVDVDHYGRKIVECLGGGGFGPNFSDAMLGMGQAIEYRGRLS